MRAIALGCIALALSTTASAGPIADQFAAGVGGVSWGMTLDELIGSRPGGEQFFSTAPGERGYAVADDAPLFSRQSAMPFGLVESLRAANSRSPP